MKNLLAILFLLAASVFSSGASAAYYTCPSGGGQSGSTCYYGPSVQYYYCPSGGSLSGTTCVNYTSYGASVASYYCPSGGSLSGTTCTVGGSYAASATTICFDGGSQTRPSDCWQGIAWWVTTYSCPSGGSLSGTTCSNTSTYGASVASYYCPSGGNLSGATCYLNTAATPVYYCPSGGGLSGTTCSYAGTLNYQCNGGDALINATTCKPALLTSTSTDTYDCPVVAGDPVGAGWWLNTLGTTSVTQQSNVAAPLCRFNPPTIDGVYSYSSYSCTSPNTLSGVLCWPPIQALQPAKSTGYSCPSPDVLGGTVCTPPIAIIPAILNTAYTCSGVNDYLSAVTHQCIPLLQTALATATTAYTCEKNAVLNPVTNVCHKLNIPAIAIQGAWSCPADYTLSGSWCLPNALSTYPAYWYLGVYTCPNGGSTGAIPGLCYK